MGPTHTAQLDDGNFVCTEALVIGLLLLLPLWKTVGLPAVRTVSTPVSLGRPEPAPAPRPRTGTPVANVSNFEGVRLIEPGRIPPTIKMGPDAEAPQPPGVFMPGITGIGSGLGLPTGLWSPGGGSRPVPQPPAPTTSTTRVVRTSTILEGNLIRRVLPVLSAAGEKCAHPRPRCSGCNHQ